jgi:hypothetical protein
MAMHSLSLVCKQWLRRTTKIEKNKDVYSTSLQRNNIGVAWVFFLVRQLAERRKANKW